MHRESSTTKQLNTIVIINILFCQKGRDSDSYAEKVIKWEQNSFCLKDNQIGFKNGKYYATCE